jgi:hypothetical protein
MRGKKTPLNLTVASPCTERWEGMQGDERVRHCARCQLNVYNLHELTMSEVEALLRDKKGRLCARLYQRRDGTVITRDCPVGLRKVRMRMAASLVTAAAFTGAVFVTLLQLGAGEGVAGFARRFGLFKEEAHQWRGVETAVETLDPTFRKAPMVGGTFSQYDY